MVQFLAGIILFDSPIRLDTGNPDIVLGILLVGDDSDHVVVIILRGIRIRDHVADISAGHLDPERSLRHGDRQDLGVGRAALDRGSDSLDIIRRVGSDGTLHGEGSVRHVVGSDELAGRKSGIHAGHDTQHDIRRIGRHAAHGHRHLDDTMGSIGLGIGDRQRRKRNRSVEASLDFGLAGRKLPAGDERQGSKSNRKKNIMFFHIASIN